MANAAIQVNTIKNAGKNTTIKNPDMPDMPTTPTEQSGGDSAPIPSVDNLAGFGIIQEAPRAWVLESDVSSNVEANRRLERRAILG